MKEAIANDRLLTTSKALLLTMTSAGRYLRSPLLKIASAFMAAASER
jgi:hypothetical protein